MPRPPQPDRVDVLMPVYNAAPYIEQAIGSIVSQTHENWRLLIQDDGSTDDSLSLARACAARDSRIEILPPFATNRGVGAAANALLTAVRGDFVTWQDADDYSDPRRLAMQVAFLNSHPVFGAVGTGAQIVSVTGHPLQQEIYPQDPRVHRKDPSLCCASVMSRRDAAAFAGLFRHDHGGGADMDWIMRLADRYDITNIDDVLYMYRETPASITRSNGLGICQRFHMLALDASRVRRAGGVDPLDALIEDGKFACPDDGVFINHLGLTLHQKLFVLRHPLPGQNRLVSVLIPYRNAGKYYFNACLAGLAEQTFRNFELVIHDDGSDQPLSRERIEQAVPGIPVTLTRSQHHEGLGAARNHLLKNAKGAFLVWQDADDVSTAYRLQGLLSHLLRYDACAAVGSSVAVINDKGDVTQTRGFDHEAFSLRGGRFSGVAASYMLRWDAVARAGGFAPELTGGFGDVYYLHKVNRYGAVHNVEDVLYRYRGDENRITGQGHNDAQDFYRVMLMFLGEVGLKLKNGDQPPPCSNDAQDFYRVMLMFLDEAGLRLKNGDQPTPRSLGDKQLSRLMSLYRVLWRKKAFFLAPSYRMSASSFADIGRYMGRFNVAFKDKNPSASSLVATLEAMDETCAPYRYAYCAYLIRRLKGGKIKVLVEDSRHAGVLISEYVRARYVWPCYTRIVHILCPHRVPGCTIRSKLHQLKRSVRDPGQGGILRRGLKVMVLSYQLGVLGVHWVFVKNRTLKAQGVPLFARLSFISGRIGYVLSRIASRVRRFWIRDSR